MADKRPFRVTRNETVYKTVVYEVRAKSFEEAQELVESGYGDWEDEDEYDRDCEDVTDVECMDCWATEEDNCDCEKADSNAFMEELGL